MDSLQQLGDWKTLKEFLISTDSTFLFYVDLKKTTLWLVNIALYHYYFINTSTLRYGAVMHRFMQNSWTKWDGHHLKGFATQKRQ